MKLHSALIPYITDSNIGKLLRHPLVYQVPFYEIDMIIEQTNFMFIYKKRKLKEALKNKNFSSYIFIHERPYRLNAFSKIEAELIDRTFWELFLDVWTDSENIFQMKAEWLELISSRIKPSKRIMKAIMKDDIKAFNELPSTFKIYRGTSPLEKSSEPGLSWTLDFDKAKWFAKRFHKDGVVIHKTITKEEVLFYYNGRSEQEIILTPKTK